MTFNNNNNFEIHKHSPGIGSDGFIEKFSKHLISCINEKNMFIEHYGYGNYGIVSSSGIDLHIRYLENQNSNKCIVRTEKGKRLITKLGGEEELKEKYGIKEFQYCTKN